MERPEIDLSTFPCSIYNRGIFPHEKVILTIITIHGIEDLGILFKNMDISDCCEFSINIIPLTLYFKLMHSLLLIVCLPSPLLG